MKSLLEILLVGTENDCTELWKEKKCGNKNSNVYGENCFGNDIIQYNCSSHKKNRKKADKNKQRFFDFKKNTTSTI